MKRFVFILGIISSVSVLGHTNYYDAVERGITSRMTTSPNNTHDLTDVFSSSGMTSNEFSQVLVDMVRHDVFDAGRNGLGQEMLVEFLSVWGTTNAVETLERVFENCLCPLSWSAWDGLVRINGLTTNMLDRLTVNLPAQTVPTRECLYQRLRMNALRYPVSSPERGIVKVYLISRTQEDYMLAGRIDRIILTIDPSYRNSADRLSVIRAALDAGLGHRMLDRRYLVQEKQRLESILTE